jgi:hypothetical protein
VLYLHHLPKNKQEVNSVKLEDWTRQEEAIWESYDEEITSFLITNRKNPENSP